MSLAELQQAVQQGQYSVARKVFSELMNESGAPLSLIFCEMSVGEYRQGNLKTALTFAEAGEAILLRQSVPDSGLLGRLRLNLMAYYLENGDVARTLMIGQKWLKELGDDPSAGYRRGRIYYNLALAYRQRGGPNDDTASLQHYELACADLKRIRENDPTPEERERCRLYEVMALQNAAWLLCEAGATERATAYATEAAILVHSGDQSAQREQVLVAAHVALRQSEVQQCLSLLEDFGLYGGEKAPARQQFWAAWLAAHAYRLSEQRLLAEIQTAIAVDQAHRTHAVYLMRRANDLSKMVDSRG